MTTRSWAAWVAMVMVVALATTNPLYLVVVLLAVALVAALAPKSATGAATLKAVVAIGFGLFLIGIAIATVNGGYGEHQLFRMPGPSAPSWMGGLRIGGPVTVEALLAATLRGLAILSVLTAFVTFNSAVSAQRALRLAPAALFHAGLVVTVGLTLLPSTVEDVRRIRELRAMRGMPGGVRSLPGLVVPAVVGGLERSLRLAEAMEARGFASAPPPPMHARLAGMAAAPIFALAAWIWMYRPDLQALAWTLALVAAAALAWWARATAGRRRTTRLNVEQLTRIDAACLALSALVIAVTLGGRGAGWVNLGYDPFAALVWPPFGTAETLIALSCAWPALRLVTATPATSPELAQSSAEPARP